MRIVPVSLNYARVDNRRCDARNFDCISQRPVINKLPNAYYPAFKGFDVNAFFENIKYENAEIEQESRFVPNPAAHKLRALDNLSYFEKREFVDDFCKMTGFPDFAKVAARMDKEITGAIYKLSGQEGFDVLFIGRDRNSSLGRQMAFPGSDPDALFYIINPQGEKPWWFAGDIRWKLKDNINQRVLSTHAGSLPEVLTLDYIKEGLELVDETFKKLDFSGADLERFKENLFDNSNDFIKSAEFNIRIANAILPAQEKEKAYKTGMFVELIKDGKILANNFDEETLSRIENSVLYKYSNIIKQGGLQNNVKNKLTERVPLAQDFNGYSDDEKFSIVKDIIRKSFLLEPENTANEKYFSSGNGSGGDQMGNNWELWGALMSSDPKYYV